MISKIKLASYRLMKLLKLIVLISSKEMDNHQTNSSYTFFDYKLMLNDKKRVRSYREAIRKVADGKVAVDIGTGPVLILALMCERYGADRIFAIEENRMAAAHASKLIKKQASKIELFKGFSTDIDLPEKIDLLVHEIIGPIASCEGMAYAVNDIKKRLANKKCVFVPAECSSYISPVSAPKRGVLSQVVSRLLSGEETNSKKLYTTLNFPVSNILAPPKECEKINFADDFPLVIDTSMRFKVEKTGPCDGFLFHIKVKVDEENVLENYNQDSHWPQPYLKLLEKPCHLSVGDYIDARYRCDLSTDTPKYQINATFKPDGEKPVHAQHKWSGSAI